MTLHYHVASSGTQAMCFHFDKSQPRAKHLAPGVAPKCPTNTWKNEWTRPDHTRHMHVQCDNRQQSRALPFSLSWASPRTGAEPPAPGHPRSSQHPQSQIWEEEQREFWLCLDQRRLYKFDKTDFSRPAWLGIKARQIFIESGPRWLDFWP